MITLLTFLNEDLHLIFVYSYIWATDVFIWAMDIYVSPSFRHLYIHIITITQNHKGYRVLDASSTFSNFPHTEGKMEKWKNWYSDIFTYVTYLNVSSNWASRLLRSPIQSSSLRQGLHLIIPNLLCLYAYVSRVPLALDILIPTAELNKINYSRSMRGAHKGKQTSTIYSYIYIYIYTWAIHYTQCPTSYRHEGIMLDSAGVLEAS